MTRTVNGQDVYKFCPNAGGTYAIEFADVDHLVRLKHFDITVADATNTIQTGRLYSKNWGIRTPPVSYYDLPECDWDRKFNGTIYSYTEMGFVTKIDFSGATSSVAQFQGLSFNLAFNTFGAQKILQSDGSLDIIASRQSVEYANTTNSSIADNHSVFLNEPDISLFPSPDDICGAIVGKNIVRCNNEATELKGIEFIVSKAGEFAVYIDANCNGDYQDMDDVKLATFVSAVEAGVSQMLSWDGKDGMGRELMLEEVCILSVYTQGVNHWAAYDVEFLKSGFCVETVRPICPNATISTNHLYWDDVDINGSDDYFTRNNLGLSATQFEIQTTTGTGQPKTNDIDGCSCQMDDCRTWTNFQPNAISCNWVDDASTIGYGDKNTLNTWWYSNIVQQVNTGFKVACNSTLPVELLSFDAKAEQKGVQLTWTTASEIDFSHYEVQHSTDAKTFTSIGRVMGSENSLSEQAYTYHHETPKSGKNYYRLKMVDLDGSHEYSPIQVVQLEGKQNEVMIAPNPFSDFFHISHTEQQAIEVEVYTAKGALLARQSYTDNNVMVNTSGLASGIYLVKVKTQDRITTHKLVKY
ncbi:MAG: T9SS type A sorting domain-containing protein [Bacteroidota bacterium]